MPYWVHDKIKNSAFSVIVETAQEALEKMTELSDSAHVDVIVKDLLGNVVDVTELVRNQRPLPSSS